MPDAMVSRMEKVLDMAVAAIAFIGWTGSGMPKIRPVRMLARPVKTRVEGRETDRVRVKASRRGRRVPRSPREPESSASGVLRIVSIL